MNYLEAAQSAIRSTHGCDATYLESVAVTEMYQGKTVWDGQVEVFAVEHPSGAAHCYAWGYRNGDRTHFVCVLGLGPIASARDAVKAAVVAELQPSA
jgi:hypothetical protein